MNGTVVVPFTVTCRLLMFGTEEMGIVTLKKAVVPFAPVAVNTMLVELLVTFAIVASLLIEQPVPQAV